MLGLSRTSFEAINGGGDLHSPSKQVWQRWKQENENQSKHKGPGEHGDLPLVNCHDLNQLKREVVLSLAEWTSCPLRNHGRPQKHGPLDRLAKKKVIEKFFLFLSDKLFAALIFERQQHSQWGA